MGTPLPENLIDNDCANCWGPGKTFGDFDTPRVINVALTKLLPGEHWNPDHEQLLLTTHLLEQQIGNCLWAIDDGIFFWRYQFGLFFTIATVRRNADNKPVFVDNFPPTCNTDIESSLLQPLGNVAYGGFLNAYWDQEEVV